jgi:hypothetical protein
MKTKKLQETTIIISVLLILGISAFALYKKAGVQVAVKEGQSADAASSSTPVKIEGGLLKMSKNGDYVYGVSGWVDQNNFGSIYIVDVKDKNNPRIAWTSEQKKYSKAIAVGNYLYAMRFEYVNISLTKVFIDVYDITDKNKVLLVSKNDMSISGSRCFLDPDTRNTTLNNNDANDKFLYLSDNGSINVVSLSDPQKLSCVKTIDLAGTAGQTKSISVNSGFIFVEDNQMEAATEYPVIKIYDIKDPLKPVLSGTIKYPKDRIFKDISSLAASGDYLYVGNVAHAPDKGVLDIYNVKNKTVPYIESTVELGKNIENIKVDGSIGYLYASGLNYWKAYCLKNISNPTELNSLTSVVNKITGVDPFLAQNPHLYIIQNNALRIENIENIIKDSDCALAAISQKNLPPVATPVSKTTRPNIPIMISLSGTDPEKDSLTFKIETKPSHGTVQLISKNSARYTPGRGYRGNDSFTFTANDGKSSSASATVSIAIR